MSCLSTYICVVMIERLLQWLHMALENKQGGEIADPLNMTNEEMSNTSERIANEAAEKYAPTAEQVPTTPTEPEGAEKIETLKAEISETIGTGSIVAPIIVDGDRYHRNIEVEGENLMIDGKMYSIEGKTGGAQSDKYEVKNIATGEVEKMDGAKLRPIAKERNEKINESYRTRFNFSAEEIETLENDPEYSKLSMGQKQFVLEQLTATTIEKVDELAEGRFKQEQAQKGWGGRVMSGIFKQTAMTGVRSRTFNDLRNATFEEQKNTIDALVSRVQIMDTPIIENEKGELEVQYASGIADMVKGETEMSAQEEIELTRLERRFNQAATRLHNIPPEWESENATNEHLRLALEAKYLFDNEKKALETIYAKNNPEKEVVGEDFALKLGNIRNNIELNRMMNAHPENEKVLNDLHKSSAGKGWDLAKSGFNDLVVKEKKYQYMAAGFTAKKYIEAVTYASGAAIGGVLGIFRGRAKAKINMRENENAMRLGAESKLSDKAKSGKFDIAMDTPVMTTIENHDKNFTQLDSGKQLTGLKGYVEKINDISKKMQNAESEQEAAHYKAMLDNRIQYAIERARKGKISFGNKEERISNQMAFAEAIKNASIQSSAADPDAIEYYKSVLGDRMKEVYGKQDSEENAARFWYMTKHAAKSATLGAAFGAGGVAIHNVVEAMRGANIHEAAADAFSNNGQMPSEEHAHNLVGVIPTGRLQDGSDINEFFNKNPGATNDEVATATAPTNYPKINHDPYADIGMKSEEHLDPMSGRMPIGRLQDGQNIDEFFSNEPQAPESTPENLIPEPEDTPATIPDEAPDNTPEIENDYIINPEKVEFSSKGSIETFRELKAKLAEDYADVAPENIPPSVQEMLDSDPTKLAIKFGFYKPGEVEESAMVMRGSTLEVDSDGNILYRRVGEDTARTLESVTGDENYNYDEKMFDYNNTHAINHSALEKPDASVPDKGMMYEDGLNSNDFDPSKNTVVMQQIEDAQNVVEKVQYGKPLTGNTTTSTGNYPTSNPNYVVHNSGRTGGVSGRFPNQQPYYETGTYPTNNYRQNIHEVVNGRIIINGQEMQRHPATQELIPSFDGRVNRQFDKLMGESFGARNNLGDVVVDRNVSKMLRENLAINDINSIPTNPNDSTTAHYLDMVKRIRAESGLQPKPNETTGFYVKEALQKMKNDGKNIRRFVRELIEREHSGESANLSSTAESTGSKGSPMVDDVYK